MLGVGSLFGSAAGGAISKPAISGVSGSDRVSTGGNFINNGNPLQNVGDILKYLNAGSSVNGGFPTFPSSAIPNINSKPLLTGSIGVGNSKAGLSIGMLGGIGLASLAAFLYFRKHK